MKKLDEIEARTIVNTADTPGDATNTFIISAPGSYYLTGNLTGDTGKHGISIQANDVTLDLNGFVLISGGAPVCAASTHRPPSPISRSQRKRAGVGRRRGVCHFGHRAGGEAALRTTRAGPA